MHTKNLLKSAYPLIQNIIESSYYSRGDNHMEKYTRMNLSLDIAYIQASWI